MAAKEHNPRWGCPRIAQQISLAFGVAIDKDVVRRILSAHYQPALDSAGPSWLMFLGHAKDSLWSYDFVPMRIRHLKNPLGSRCHGSIHSRRIIGFGVHRGAADGVKLCCMFGRAISRKWSSQIPQF